MFEAVNCVNGVQYDLLLFVLLHIRDTSSRSMSRLASCDLFLTSRSRLDEISL